MLRDFQCALVHYILQTCYKLVLLTVINGYQLLVLMVLSLNISNSIITIAWKKFRGHYPTSSIHFWMAK